MRVPPLNLAAQYAALRAELEPVVARVLESGAYVMGADVERFEREFAAFHQGGHAVACANGSDAILLALMALEVEPGDEVIVPSFTFFATAGSVVRAGATPVFADIDPATYTLDPADVARRITPRTRAIIPVHLYGQCADMGGLIDLAWKHNLNMIEDCAQCIGATWNVSPKSEPAAHAPSGMMGDIGTYSFYPTKNLGAAGDGGMLITPHAHLAERLRKLRLHGETRKYYHDYVGFNSRLDALQAALLTVKLNHLRTWNEARRRVAAAYTEGLRGLPGIITPRIAERATHVFHQYTIRAPRRDALLAHLQQAGIGAGIYYPLGLHLQQCFTSLGGKPGDLPHTEAACREVLSLPIYPELTTEQIGTVIAAVRAFSA